MQLNNRSYPARERLTGHDEPFGQPVTACTALNEIDAGRQVIKVPGKALVNVGHVSLLSIAVMINA